MSLAGSCGGMGPSLRHNSSLGFRILLLGIGPLPWGAMMMSLSLSSDNERSRHGCHTDSAPLWAPQWDWTVRKYVCTYHKAVVGQDWGEGWCWVRFSPIFFCVCLQLAHWVISGCFRTFKCQNLTLHKNALNISAVILTAVQVTVGLSLWSTLLLFSDLPFPTPTISS